MVQIWSRTTWTLGAPKPAYSTVLVVKKVSPQILGGLQAAAALILLLPGAGPADISALSLSEGPSATLHPESQPSQFGAEISS